MLGRINKIALIPHNTTKHQKKIIVCYTKGPILLGWSSMPMVSSHLRTDITHQQRTAYWWCLIEPMDAMPVKPKDTLPVDPKDDLPVKPTNAAPETTTSLPSVVASSLASSMPSFICISLANQARVPRPRP